MVPGTRGVEQSRPREAIVGEVAELVAEGFREVGCTFAAHATPLCSFLES